MVDPASIALLAAGIAATPGLWAAWQSMRDRRARAEAESRANDLEGLKLLADEQRAELTRLRVIVDETSRATRDCEVREARLRAEMARLRRDLDLAERVLGQLDRRREWRANRGEGGDG